MVQTASASRQAADRELPPEPTPVYFEWLMSHRGYGEDRGNST